MSKKKEIKWQGSFGDIIIGVVGLSGSGKTTFIDSATHQNTASDSLDPVTTMRVVRAGHPKNGNPYVFIELPGITHDNESDRQLLAMISDWLHKTYNNGVKLSGIVYLHRITDIRVSQSPIPTMLEFRELCGGRNLSGILVFATTMWDEGIEQLDTTEQSWLKMTSGYPCLRFDNTSVSAWNIVDKVVERSTGDTHVELQGRLRENPNIQLKSISSEDTIIILMGPTGTGKSTFINIATIQNTNLGVGHTLKSHTSAIRAVRFPHPPTGNPYVLIDTPGFDNTTKSDTQILATIAEWLEKTYKNSIKISGIIYLHRITDNRMSSSPLKDLRLLTKLCGSKAISKVVLATTMWSNFNNNIQRGEQRQRELEGSYWNGMTTNGSASTCFRDSFKSAWDIIDMAAKRDSANTNHALLIQEELVDLQKHLSDTEAGRTLYTTLRKSLEDQKELIKQLRDSDDNDETNMFQNLVGQYHDLEDVLHRAFDKLLEMKVPLGQRIRMLLTFRKS